MNPVLISDQYRALQTQFHTERPDYGCSSRKHVDHVQSFSDQMQTRDILDYGCGKCMLQKGLPFPIQNYDPCIPEFDRAPRPADLVICTDVMEHIEPEFVDGVVADLVRLTKRALLLEVSCRPAQKFMPDGRNAHLIVERPNWWLSKFMAHMDLHSHQSTKGAFVAVFTPFSAPLG